MFKRNCPKCGSLCKVVWEGLDLVEASGDETLAHEVYVSDTSELDKEININAMGAQREMRLITERNYYKAALEKIAAMGKASPGDKKDEVAKDTLAKINQSGKVDV
jgi:hypothetical protein